MKRKRRRRRRRRRHKGGIKPKQQKFFGMVEITKSSMIVYCHRSWRL